MEILQLPLKEVVDTFLPLSLCAIAAFTLAQRKWIKERDNYTCQFPEKGNHGGTLAAHHIFPQSLARTEGFDPDTPCNGITLCWDHHDKIHDCHDEHVEAFNTDKGGVVWNSQWDSELSARALYNTKEMIRKGKHWPKKE